MERTARVERMVRRSKVTKGHQDGNGGRRSKGCGSCKAGDGKGGNTFWPPTTLAKIARVVRVSRMPRVANAASVIVTSG